MIVSFVSGLFSFYEILVVIWCILSWIPRRPGGLLDDVAGAIDAIVHPYIGLFQRVIPPVGGIDFSPVVAIFVLGIIERVVLTLLAMAF